CDNKYVGAALFSVALFCICTKGYSLFTGKIGFIPESHTKEDLSVLFLGLLGNAVSTVLLGLAVSYALPAAGAAAAAICEAKLSQEALQTFIRAFFCGVLMYLAVSIYREKNSALGIFLCIPTFILSGFEHSIANMFYFGVSGVLNLESALYILIVLLGNAAGGTVLPFLNKIMKRGA
ncbi:MAG: formate/nitrite transporter family protein, partial [Clostridia bacterium]